MHGHTSQKQSNTKRNEKNDVKDRADAVEGSTHTAEMRSIRKRRLRRKCCKPNRHQARDGDQESRSAEMWRGGNTQLHVLFLYRSSPNVCRTLFPIAAQGDGPRDLMSRGS